MRTRRSPKVFLKCTQMLIFFFLLNIAFFAPFKDMEKHQDFAVFPTKQEIIPLALQLFGLLGSYIKKL